MEHSETDFHGDWPPRTQRIGDRLCFFDANKKMQSRRSMRLQSVLSTEVTSFNREPKLLRVIFVQSRRCLIADSSRNTSNLSNNFAIILLFKCFCNSCLCVMVPSIAITYQKSIEKNLISIHSVTQEYQLFECDYTIEYLFHSPSYSCIRKTCRIFGIRRLSCAQINSGLLFSSKQKLPS